MDNDTELRSIEEANDAYYFNETRNQFAASALTGLIAHRGDYNGIAIRAFELADLMMEQMKKGKQV
jgi:hypothetical protein